MLNLQSTEYAGKASAYLISRPVAKTETFEKKCIVVETTNKQFVVRRVELDNFIQPYAPTPVDGSTLTIDSVIIPMYKWNIFFTFNPVDLKDTWSSEYMQRELIDVPLAQNDETYILAHALDRHNLFVGMNIWRGAQSMDVRNTNPVLPTTLGLPVSEQRTPQNTLSVFNGIIEQLQNSPTAINITTYGTLTATNSVAALQTVYNSIPQSMVGQYGSTGLRFIFSKNTQKLIEQNYNIISQFKNYNYGSSIENLFLQYEMVSLAEFPDNTILCTFASDDPLKSQFFFAINDQADFTNIKMDWIAPHSDFMFVKATCQAGVGVGWADQCVLLSNLTYQGY